MQSISSAKVGWLQLETNITLTTATLLCRKMFPKSSDGPVNSDGFWSAVSASIVCPSESDPNDIVVVVAVLLSSVDCP